MSRPRRTDFEEMAESIPHIVWMSAPDGSTDYFNRQGSEYTGLPPQANYGWGWVELVHQADAPGVRRRWEEATRTVTPFHRVYRIRRRDGQYRWHAGRALPVRDQDGGVERWIGTATDIDDAVRHSRQLTEIERQTNELLSLLATLPSPNQAFGHVERALRAIRVNAMLSPENPAARGDQPSTAALSQAEANVVRLIGLGYTNRETANLLAVSLRTVETHRARALQRLGLRTRAELTRFAYDAGLIDPARDLSGPDKGAG